MTDNVIQFPGKTKDPERVVRDESNMVLSELLDDRECYTAHITVALDEEGNPFVYHTSMKGDELRYVSALIDGYATQVDNEQTED